jgi:TonB family protein
MLGENNEPQVNFDSIQGVSESKRRLQMLFALGLLLTALVLLVLKNKQFWSDALNLEELTAKLTTETASNSQPRVVKTPARKLDSKPNAAPSATTADKLSPETETLPAPLQVDVSYSSGRHETLVARNSAIQLDLKQSPPPVALFTGPEPGAGVQVRFSGGAMEMLGQPKEPVYPLRAQQANVQGSVVLLAKIAEDGSVQAVQVISGHPMLSGAALEAVKQWHFKPHYDDAGKAVPLETRVTVNFTISTQ